MYIYIGMIDMLDGFLLIMITQAGKKNTSAVIDARANL